MTKNFSTTKNLVSDDKYVTIEQHTRSHSQPTGCGLYAA